jgi:septum formation protein
MVTPFDNLKDYSIILASNSPRRRELLQKTGLPFSVKVIDGINECYPQELDVAEIPQFISRTKAEAYNTSITDNQLVITADTIVALDKQVLGKPHSRKEAINMLESLSGRTHLVITGVTVMTKRNIHTFASESRVMFAPLQPDEIQWYIDTFNPFDKAGSYGIQEWIGMIGISHIEGSFFNVMGLPVHKLYNFLKNIRPGF